MSILNSNAAARIWIAGWIKGYEGKLFCKAEKIITLTGSSSKIIHKDLPANDPQQRQPDIRKANKVFGWKPKVSLDEGLKSTIAYFDEILSDE